MFAASHKPINYYEWEVIITAIHNFMWMKITQGLQKFESEHTTALFDPF